MDGGYTRIPNEIIDAMPEMTPAQVSLCLALCRLTHGWQRPAAEVSISELARMTGLSRRGILNIQDKIGRFFIRDGKKWTVNSVHSLLSESVNSVHSTSAESVNSVHSLEGQSVNSVHSEVRTEFTDLHLSKEKKEIIILIKHFEEQTGLIPPNDTTDNFKDHWLKPLTTILASSGNDVDEARRRISEAVKVLWSGNGGRRYTIKWPKSIMTAIANLPPATSAQAETDWQVVRDAAAAGNAAGIPDHLKPIVRKIGWEKLQRMDDFTRPQYQRQFMEART